MATVIAAWWMECPGWFLSEVFHSALTRLGKKAGMGSSRRNLESDQSEKAEQIRKGEPPTGPTQGPVGGKAADLLIRHVAENYF